MENKWQATIGALLVLLMVVAMMAYFVPVGLSVIFVANNYGEVWGIVTLAVAILVTVFSITIGIDLYHSKKENDGE